MYNPADGSVVGTVGYADAVLAGATARATARLAAALGMRVIAYDPYVDPGHPELDRLGLTLAPLAEVVAQADVLSVHLPSTPDTRHLVDADLLALMRPGAILINVGRGEVLDEEALADALERGDLGGAGLDVREQEPPPSSRLHQLSNVVLTPHVAGITHQAQHRIASAGCCAPRSTAYSTVTRPPTPSAHIAVHIRR